MPPSGARLLDSLARFTLAHVLRLGKRRRAGFAGAPAEKRVLKEEDDEVDDEEDEEDEEEVDEGKQGKAAGTQHALD